MPGAGIEPARCCQRWILSPVRLPVPPSRLQVQYNFSIIARYLPVAKPKMRTNDFNFNLPERLIAQHPTPNRTASKLLMLNGESGLLQDSQFTKLPTLLSAGDCLIFNDTRVIKARLFGHKLSGGAVEVLIERVLNQHEAFAQIRASRALKAGGRMLLGDGFEAEVLGRDDDMFHLKFHHALSVLEILERAGRLPLPPYITHAADNTDETRYQTVYAKHAGAVAAPTAGLHFDDAMLEKLANLGINIGFVTLHVGAGTFQPVRVDNIADHKMHSEHYTISNATADLIARTKTANKNVIAVGTTSLRALESAARNNPNNLAGDGETDIFITPGFQFKIVDKLITNFHLPKSTLLMLVSAFAGVDNIQLAYQHAIAQQYRFFSYGDAMLLTRKPLIEPN